MKKLSLAALCFTSLFALACEQRTITVPANEAGARVTGRGEGERELTPEEARTRREVDIARAEADRARADADKHEEAADALDAAAEAREDAAKAAADAARKQAEASAKDTEARAKDAAARASSSPITPITPSTTSPSAAPQLKIAPDAATAPAMDSNNPSDAGPM